MEISTHDTPTNDMSRQDATGRDNEQYTVSVSEAAELFTVAGLPRTERAIQRFCKKGDLLCAFQETAYGSRYLIKRSSIDRLIQQKLQALTVTPESDSRDVSRQDAAGRDVSRHDIDAPIIGGIREARLPQRNSAPQSRDTSERQGTTGPDAITFQKLREENLELKIDNAARQQFINHLSGALEKSTKEVQELSYNLGATHTRLVQLEAPRSAQESDDTPTSDMSRPVATPSENPISASAVVVEQSKSGGDVELGTTPPAVVTDRPSCRCGGRFSDSYPHRTTRETLAGV